MGSLVPQLGIKFTISTSEGEVLTTELPGKSLSHLLKKKKRKEKKKRNHVTCDNKK